MAENIRLTKERFEDPPADCRAMPFWAWNGKLLREKMLRQIADFRKMGFGGFYMHSRIGLADEYLGETFMQRVRECCDVAGENGMLACLYDEDKWPSGFGGGRVTANPDFAQRYLLFSAQRYEDGKFIRGKHTSGRLTENGTIRLLQAYRVVLKDGRLESYSLTDDAQAANRYAYQVVTGPLAWFNHAPYADVLNPDAVDAFLACTHARYHDALGARIEKRPFRIFTDEPQFSRVENLPAPEGEAGIPWTDGFDALFAQYHGGTLLSCLPEVFFEAADGSPATARYHYMNMLSDRFSQVFMQRVGDWCAANGMVATGHLMDEDTLLGQTKCCGDPLRAYRGLRLPGIDMLADACHLNTAKQAQSAAHQQGREGVLCEAFGVTNWDFDFRGHKRQGDWLAALGVTARVPHLSWLQMGGESKRDYPASLDARSPWFEKYRLIEDHLARVTAAMTSGKPVVRVGVLHPIESYWLCYGPEGQTAQKRAEMQQRFDALTQWLLSGLIDFDFISEDSALRAENGKLCVGAMAYDAVIVPPVETIRETTLTALSDFLRQGGMGVFLGDAPACVDAALSGAAAPVFARGVRLPFEKEALLDALEAVREVEIRRADGQRADELVYQLREADGERYLFIAHGAPKGAGTKLNGVPLYLTVPGKWRVTRMDTQTGGMREQHAGQTEKETAYAFLLGEHDALLLRLERGESTVPAEKPDAGVCTEIALPDIFEAGLCEENVLLLDSAQWRLDGGEWQERTDILKADNSIRRALSLPLRTDAFPQPWLTKGEKHEKHAVALRFRILSEIEAANVTLALEGAEHARICWNGCAVTAAPQGYYLDDAIARLPLGALHAGENELLVEYAFDTGVNLESMYLLGDFGVRVCGAEAVITPPVTALRAGDASAQGLAFYGGSLQYRCRVTVEKGGRAALRVADYAAPLLSVTVDGGAEKPFYTWPYEADLGELSAGGHDIVITAYGNRYNTLGQLHNIHPTMRYFGPASWRTEGEYWQEAYRFKPFGLTHPPVLLMK